MGLIALFILQRGGIRKRVKMLLLRLHQSVICAVNLVMEAGPGVTAALAGDGVLRY